MPMYRMEMVNAHFESSDESEYPSLDAALKAAVISAIRVTSDSVMEGTASSAVEVRISDADRILAHRVVNLSVSEMLPDD